MTEPFEYPNKPMDRGKILWEGDLERLNGDWGRYRDVDGDAIEGTEIAIVEGEIAHAKLRCVLLHIHLLLVQALLPVFVHELTRISSFIRVNSWLVFQPLTFIFAAMRRERALIARLIRTMVTIRIAPVAMALSKARVSIAR